MLKSFEVSAISFVRYTTAALGGLKMWLRERAWQAKREANVYTGWTGFPADRGYRRRVALLPSGGTHHRFID